MVTREDDYYGYAAHRYSFNVSSIPNIASMEYEKDFFIGIVGAISSQSDVGAGPTFVDITNGVLHMRTPNGMKQLQICIYYNSNF